MQITSQIQTFDRFQTRSSPTEATYSPQGKATAAEGIEVYDSYRGQWTKSTENASHSFASIASNRSTTSTEKDLAGLGLRLNTYKSFSPKTRARMMRSVLGSIAAAVPGPTGQVLAQAGLQVLNYGVSDQPFSRIAAKEALSTIVTSSQSESREKSFAALGIELGLERTQAPESLAIRRSVLNTLANGLGSEPLPQVFARTTSDATSVMESQSWEPRNHLTLRGLQEIQSLSDCKSRDRALAETGIVLGEGFNAQDAYRVRKAFLEEIMVDSEDSAPTAIAKAALSVSALSVGNSVKAKVLEKVLTEVLTNPDSTPTQRHHARQGLQHSSYNQRLSEMKQIFNSVESSPK